MRRVIIKITKPASRTILSMLFIIRHHSKQKIVMISNQKEKESLFISQIYKGSLLDLYKFLRTHQLDPFSCKDSRGYSALHIASINNSTSIAQFLFRYVRENYPQHTENVLKYWVSLTNDEGFTCLHFAVFKGNLVRTT